MRVALLVCFLTSAGLPAPRAVRAWSEFGEVTPPAAPAGPEIREPLFAFLLGLAQADSVGEWTGARIREYASREGRESRFPLDDLVSVTRSRPDSTAAVRYSGQTVVALWHIVMSAALDRAMPYSILGYHPGSLRMARELRLSELAPVDLSLSVQAADPGQRTVIADVRIFALEGGYVLLDADGWLDALLGAGLDDSWLLGFVVGREEGRLLGLGVSVGREGRPIFGEFDFANDKVLAHGRPQAAALSRASRRWLNTTDGHLPSPWTEPTDQE